MIGRLIRRFVGEWCKTHDQGYRSDFCPMCVREMFARMDKIDARPEWHESDVTWRKKNRVTAVEAIATED